MRSNALPAALESVLEGDLIEALGRDEIEVLFQPQFACRDGRMVGAEALSRWQHPTLGEIGARDLFSIAEKAGLVAPLSRHVVAQALEQADSWPKHLTLSLNITPEEIAEPSFARDFASLVASSGIAPKRQTLEITEDVLLHDLNLAADALRVLHRAGFRIALDDFGAGFCNFRYLKMLPLDALKLDRSMVEGITSDARDLAVLRAIVSLAEALELDVIAEGIETEAQRQAIIAEGCTYWQGFLKAEPMRNAQMLEFAEI
jgi:EAL domain-containing protein (putative c-di-GMP-specific phosphodiesterase class I)